MSIRSLFKTEEELEKDGVVLDFGDGDTITIARSGGANKAYNKAIKNAYMPLKKQISKGIANEDQLREKLIEVFSKTIVLAWTIKDEKGKPLAFTHENIISLFKEMPALFDHVVEEADRLENFQKQLIEEDVETLKND